MQRIILQVFLILLTSSALGQMTGGIRGGLNINNVIVTNKSGTLADETFKSRYSFHAGSFVQNTFSDHFGWRIEMLFSNKGYTFEYEGEKTEVSLNYLNWPLLLVYTAGSKLDLEAGIELGYMISGEQRFNDFDAGMDIGARYHLNDKLNLGLRYNIGFPFKFNFDDPAFADNQPVYQHSVLQFSIGYNLIYETNGDQ